MSNSKAVHFTTYDKTSNKILRTILCPPNLVALQRLRLGESMIMGKFNGITQKIINGKAVDKNLSEINQLKIQNPRLRFDTSSPPQYQIY